MLFSYNFESSLFREGCLDRRNVGERKRGEQRKKKVHTMFTKKSSVMLSNIKIIIILRLYLKKNYQLNYSQGPCLL